MSLNRHTEQQIDQLLLERGEYRPLEFLVREGRLDYGDYEAWRNGEVRDLSELLFGDPEQIVQTLLQAAEYLQRRGWESERLVYRPRGGSGTEALRFSQDQRLDDCFHGAYRKPADRPQLDLFTDTSATYRVNGVIRALERLDAADARHSLSQLSETAPDHPHLGELERLTEALESLGSDRDMDVEEALRRLQGETTWLAERHLHRASGQLLIPLWRRLSTALADHPFGPSRPELHLSYTAAQARDWPEVRRGVEREAAWNRQAVLLERHALACSELREEAAALKSWYLLCWQFPERGDRLEKCGDHALKGAWQDFLDLDPELPVQAFPAWLLLHSPGTVGIAPDADDAIPCPDSYRTLLRLKRCAQEQSPAANNEPVMELRARLKQQDPSLFHHFLATLG